MSHIDKLIFYMNDERDTLTHFGLLSDDDIDLIIEALEYYKEPVVG